MISTVSPDTAVHVTDAPVMFVEPVTDQPAESEADKMDVLPDTHEFSVPLPSETGTTVAIGVEFKPTVLAIECVPEKYASPPVVPLTAAFTAVDAVPAASAHDLSLPCMTVLAVEP